jgi:hypothetical protein
VYNVESGAEVSRIEGPGKIVQAVFDAKSNLFTVALIGNDIEVRSVPLDTKDLVAELCKRLSGAVTREQLQLHCSEIGF